MKVQSDYTEAQVAQELGVGREEIASIRKNELFEKEHWFRRGREIVLTVLGLEKVLAFIGSPAGVKMAAGDSASEKEKSRAVAPVAAPVSEYTARLKKALDEKSAAGFCTVRVTKVFVGKRIMFADHLGQPVRIVVRDSTNFLPGMEIPVKHAHDEVYTFEGRMPSRRGRLVR